LQGGCIGVHKFNTLPPKLSVSSNLKHAGFILQTEECTIETKAGGIPVLFSYSRLLVNIFLVCSIIELHYSSRVLAQQCSGGCSSSKASLTVYGLSMGLPRMIQNTSVPSNYRD
jgi:hypothetical protein